MQFAIIIIDNVDLQNAILDTLVLVVRENAAYSVRSHVTVIMWRDIVEVAVKVDGVGTIV
jgi:hypothetical protein